MPFRTRSGSQSKTGEAGLPCEPWDLDEVCVRGTCSTGTSGCGLLRKYAKPCRR